MAETVSRLEDEAYSSRFNSIWRALAELRDEDHLRHVDHDEYGKEVIEMCLRQGLPEKWVRRHVADLVGVVDSIGDDGSADRAREWRVIRESVSDDVYYDLKAAAGESNVIELMRVGKGMVGILDGLPLEVQMAWRSVVFYNLDARMARLLERAALVSGEISRSQSVLRFVLCMGV